MPVYLNDNEVLVEFNYSKIESDQVLIVKSLFRLFVIKNVIMKLINIITHI